MPTYEYKCTACDHRFEQFQSMKDKALKKCPECGKNALERLIGTGAAVLFKGSGFYQTDYRSEGYKKAAAAEKPATESKPDSAKSDSKPAASNGASKPAEAKAPAKPETKKKSE
jgi:putative FmdB family regulatory protein